MSAPLPEVDGLDRLRNCHRMLVLSPHPDDVAYSLGGIVEQFPQFLDWTILTLFSRSLYVAGNHQELTVDEVSCMREKEDKLYASRVGATLIQFGFADASVLGYTAESELSCSYEGARFEAVCSVFDKLLSDFKPGRIVAPLGLGGHVDHRIVHEAVRLRLSALGADVWYYEDLPYACSLSESELISEVNLRLRDPVPVSINITSTMTHKLEALSIYRSQLTAKDTTAILSHASRIQPDVFPYAERLWFSRESS